MTRASNGSDHEVTERPRITREEPAPGTPAEREGRPGGLWLGGLAMVVGIAVVAYSTTLPRLGDGAPGPGLFPGIAGTAMALAGLVLLLKSFRPSRSESAAAPVPGAAEPSEDSGQPEITAAGWLRMGVIAGAIGSYVVAVEQLGFLLTMAVIICAITKTLGGSWLRSTVTGVVTAAVLFVFFERLLLVQLADGVFG